MVGSRVPAAMQELWWGVTAWSGSAHPGRRVAEGEPPRDGWAGGQRALATVLRGSSRLHQLAGLAPAVGHGSVNLAEKQPL